MASITTWMRLEPRSRNAGMGPGLQARIYDPLWLLARQWQIGEFQGEDNGSPAAAHWRGEVTRLTRYHPGALPDKPPINAQAYDSATIPLETLVERESVRPQADKLERLRFAVEAGQQFLRMLERLFEQKLTSRSYRDLFISKYSFPPLTTDQRAAIDSDSQSFLDLVALRAPDGRKLYAALSAALRAPGGVKLPDNLPIAQADAAEVQVTAEAWLRWYESLVNEPSSGNSTWSDERMEYSFSVAARTSAGEKVLTAPEYYSGHLDWYDFDVDERLIDDRPVSLGATANTQSIVCATIPAPISYRGMPAPRFWEFEDAQVDFGAVDAGPEELARMLLVEFAITYGNDWFVIPVELAVGSLCRTNSLVITNTFGERMLVRPAHESKGPGAVWRMFQLASTPHFGRAAAVRDANATLFLLPPALMKSLESRPLEEVLFLRDEAANLAWGVERVIESAIEQPLNRYEQQPAAAATESAQTQEILTYHLSTDTPDYWIPLLPVQNSAGLRLKRGKMLKPDGPPEPVRALGRILNPEPPDPAGLSIYEEEIPREGVRVTRCYQLARWLDGTTYLWIGRRKVVGRGEGSSGLKFDTTEP